MKSLYAMDCGELIAEVKRLRYTLVHTEDALEEQRIRACKAEERVRELEEEARWRKWPAELVEQSGFYQVIIKGSPDTFWWEHPEDGEYSVSRALWAGHGVTHWRPITPPK